MIHGIEYRAVVLAEPTQLSALSLTRDPLPGNVDHIGHYFLGSYHGQRLVDEPLACAAREAVLMDSDRSMSFKEVHEQAEKSGLTLLPRIALVALAGANPDIEDDGPIYALGDSVIVRIPASDLGPGQRRSSQMVFLLTCFEGVRSIIPHDVRHDFPPGSRFLAAPTTRS